MKITPPLFFLLTGFLITIGFIFVPFIYDPIIIKALPIESIDRDQQLVDYLTSIQDQDNIIIGMHGYIHRDPISGDTTCEYHCPNHEIPLEVVRELIDKGMSTFEKAGLDIPWIVPPGMAYDDKFLNLIKTLGYTTKQYFLESPGGSKNTLEMVLKPDALRKISKFMGEKDEEEYKRVERPIKKPTIEEIIVEELTVEELKIKIDEIKILIIEFQTQLTELLVKEETSEIQQDYIILKEYTWGWGRKTVALEEYDDAQISLEKEMMGSINGILIHIQDYNNRTEEFLKTAMRKYKDIRVIRVDDISSSYDLPRLKNLVNLARENNRLLLMAVIPAHSSVVGDTGLAPIIKATWIVFVFFFLLPIAVMLPLHWYERRKVRGAKRIISNSPKISLIFPAYNEEKFISKTIEQGLKQDYNGELEIVIIDDGSTDRTFEIASEYAEKHVNVKVYKHTINSGKPAALNTGFQQATGEISIFSDSDSHLDSDLVSRMVPHFDDPKVGVTSGMIIVDNEINLLTDLQQIEYLYNQEIIRFCQATHKGVLICPGAATAVRTQIARDIPSTDRTVTEDADFTFEVLKAGWKVSQEPEAISRTDAPDNWKDFIEQRKRWLYGVLQTIYIHKWAIFFRGRKVPNPWVWWAWIGYITCPITTLAIIAIPLFIWMIGPSYLIFLGHYSLLIGVIYGFVYWYGIKQYTHSNKTKLILLLPIYMAYQYILNLLLFYLVIVFVLRRGITVRYGGRNIHAV